MRTTLEAIFFNLLMVAPRDFRDEEFFTPRRVLEEKGAQITVASSVKEMAKGMLGGTVRPDIAFSDVPVAPTTTLW